MAKKKSGVLTTRALNRALLARQFLLKRVTEKPFDVVQHLCGMQAQIPRPPFIGLWTRLEKFDRSELIALAQSKRLVRGTTMRGTIHLMTAPDFVHFRPRLAAMLAKAADAVVGKNIPDADVDALYQAGREYFMKNATSFDTFRKFAELRYPKLDARAVAYTVRMGLPLIMVPTANHRWGWPGNADFTLADTWLGTAIPMSATGLEDMILRYLAAYGPATPADAQTWSTLRNLKPVFEKLRPKLVTFRDQKKRELFDLPKAPRPDEDTPAPVRFLGEYDNAALSHDDRSRIVDDTDRKKLVTPNLIVMGGFTVEGFIAGTWRSETKKNAALMTLKPFGKLTKKAKAEVEAEALSLLRFVEPDSGAHTILFK